MAWIKGCDAPEDANNQIKKICCPLCGHLIQTQQHQAGIQELPGLPAGVKFDPSDHEILEHLEGKVRPNARNHHPLIDEFVPTLDGDNGICYTHPEKLPGVKRDGLVRHFFHRPSKAYTTGTRKRRKVHTNEEGGETRWHKTGKTRAILSGGSGTVMGHKKILVLYTNYGRQRRPEKTNWVMHQYHLGSSEDEKDGELVVSKVFYQTQPRQCGSGAKDSTTKGRDQPYSSPRSKDTTTSIVDYYDELSIIAYDQQVVGHHRESPPAPLMTQSSYHSSVHHDNGSSFLA